MQIHQAGGGIGYTVQCTRASSEEELRALLKQRLDRMLSQGTTVVEAKSGYGLEFATELKMLKVLRALDQSHPIKIVANYCGAHSIPAGSTAEDYTESFINEQLPAIIAEKKAGVINPELMDVFCEKGVFTTEQSRRILQAGQALGLAANFHGDELNPTGSAEMAADIKATACSHLEHVSETGMQQMAQQGVVATLLPTTAYALRIAPPPARALINAGVAVALGSDFNPNAHCMSMPFVMNLSCVTMRMTMNEALVAATLNSAHSLKCSHTHGSLEPGKQGDFVVINHAVWEHIIYEMVDPPIEGVFVGGREVFARARFVS
jgi:imidazolonepropionase